MYDSCFTESTYGIKDLQEHTGDRLSDNRIHKAKLRPFDAVLGPSYRRPGRLTFFFDHYKSIDRYLISPAKPLPFLRRFGLNGREDQSCKEMDEVTSKRSGRCTNKNHPYVRSLKTYHALGPHRRYTSNPSRISVRKAMRDDIET